MQYHKDEKKSISTALKENSIVTSSNNNMIGTQQPEITTTVNKSSVFMKSKPFWKVKSFKKDLSKAKK